jgi:hypothetical protein
MKSLMGRAMLTFGLAMFLGVVAGAAETLDGTPRTGVISARVDSTASGTPRTQKLCHQRNNL